MRVATGKIVAGKVVVEGTPFREGTTVTVIATEDGEAFELAPADEAALLAAIGEADNGGLLDASEIIAEQSQGG